MKKVGGEPRDDPFECEPRDDPFECEPKGPPFECFVSPGEYDYECWDCPCVFYPECDMECDDDKLAFFATKFNSLTISSTYHHKMIPSDIFFLYKRTKYNHSNFQYVVYAPKVFLTAKNKNAMKNEWENFWENPEGKASTVGMSLLHDEGCLGCIVLHFSPTFIFSPANMKRIEYLDEILPKDVRFTFDFMDMSWRDQFLERRPGEQTPLADLFDRHKNWSVSTPYVENFLADAGWAGPEIQSTRPGGKSMPIILTSDFVHISFHGTFGRGKGSYDEKRFLESTSVKIRKLRAECKVKAVFCSFLNTESTVCHPLPPLNINGYVLYPHIVDPPEGTDIDQPAAIHDGLKLQKIIKIQDSCKYNLDNEGYVKIRFK